MKKLSAFTSKYTAYHSEYSDRLHAASARVHLESELFALSDVPLTCCLPFAKSQSYICIQLLASKISVVSIIGSLVMLLFKNKRTNKLQYMTLACSCVLDDTLFGTHSQWKDLMSGEEGVGLELVVSDVSDT